MSSTVSAKLPTISPEPSYPRKKVLILSSSTGGGHDMRARSLQQWLQKLHPDSIETRQWQALEESSPLDRFGVNLYNFIQKSWPRVHHLYFWFLEKAALHRKSLRSKAAKNYHHLLSEFQPDILVSVHAHLNHAYFREARSFLGKPLPCYTCCGEMSGGYGFSHHWVSPEVAGFFAATEECARKAKSLGLEPALIHHTGFLLNPIFFEPLPEREDLRKSLFPDLGERPLLLLGTGANGANQHEKILRALAKLQKAIGVIALCGNNLKTLRQLEALAPKLHPLKIYPLGFQPNIRKLLVSADLAFIRPGTGSTCEAILSECPILFNGIGGIMPQERITVNFFRQRNIEAPSVGNIDNAVSQMNRFLFDNQMNLCKKIRRSFREIALKQKPEILIKTLLQ